MSGWEPDLGLLLEERRQRLDEGCVIGPDLAARLDALDREADRWNTERIEPLYAELLSLPVDPELAAREPNELAEIRRLRRSDHVDELPWTLSEPELLDRLHGAWTGRCCGCASGKPVEGMGMRIQDETLVGRKAIKAYLQGANAWPLETYIPETSLGERVPCPASTREQIAYMEPDDDIHYSYRSSGSRLIPYQVFPFKELNRQPILEVVLGPKHETPIDVVVRFLRDSGYGSVTVRRSDASYR